MAVNSRRRRLVAAAAGLLLIVGMALAWLRLGPAGAAPPAAHMTTDRLGDDAILTPAAKGNAGRQVILSQQDSEFLERLRERSAGVIHGKHAQIKALEQLIGYLMSRYPDDWRERMAAFLKALFPELADALYAKFQQLMGYNDWLRANRDALRQMSPQERQQALWNARRAAFGDDATEIFAAQVRNEQIQESLAALAVAEGLSLDDRLAAYRKAINAAYGEKATSFIQGRQTELTYNFLEVESVQNDLHALPAAERRAALRGIRAALGMDEPALQRWDALDRQRDQSWDAGQQYMRERERIQAQYDGEEEQRQLAQLQERQFDAEAETIRSEEASGFYRYDHRRRYGRE